MVLMDKLKRLIKRIALSLELGRRISLNLLFLGIVGSVFWFLLADGEEDIEEKTVLVLTLQGRLVEAQTDNDQAQWFLDWFDDDKREVVLPTLLQSLRDAAKDPKITKALLLTDGFEGGGLASMDELAKGL
ncbi:MAG TPA: hypothetical protein DCE31_08565, partial [Lautropia sp.]|nr:hypothetical protein [Lautropia sp.]